MRALFLEDLKIQESYLLQNEPLHHLVNVARLEKGEELLLLNGRGLSVKTYASEVSKRELRLEKISEQRSERTFFFDLALGMPKRDALELSLKQAVELGFQKIFLIQSAYSQMKFPEGERVHNLLVSALEQSNAPFLPEVVSTDWNKIDMKCYEKVLMLDSQTTGQETPWGPAHRALLIVGPEGGFSSEELAFFHGFSELHALRLPTPILRTPTAVAAGAGILLQSLRK